MMAGADDPATLSGLRQPMAIAMVLDVRPSSQIRYCRIVEHVEVVLRIAESWFVVDHLREKRPMEVVVEFGKQFRSR